MHVPITKVTFKVDNSCKTLCIRCRYLNKLINSDITFMQVIVIKVTHLSV